MAGGGLDPRDERFCQLYIELGNATAAYLQSRKTKCNNDTARVRACELNKRPEVQERIAELRAMAADKATDTIQSIAAQLDEDRRFARENNNPGAAVSATAHKAKLLGLYVEKKDVQVGFRPGEADTILASFVERYGKAAP